MPDAWDTSVLSRTHEHGRYASLLTTHRREALLVPLPAPAIQELVRGLSAPHLPREPAQSRLRWFAALIEDPLAQVVAFGSVAAQLSGWLLAQLPHPPTRNHRRHGTRAQQRAAWALDVQIAACAFAGGYGVLTENVDDFGLLRDAMASLLPEAPPLAVTDARV
ncbi:MAG TPA: hypothetical protein VFU94_05985 [Conexibacter sp.]|nr:hypothetical protein [Conexibacter sp.]